MHIIEPPHDKPTMWLCAQQRLRSAYLDQHGHPPSLIRAFACAQWVAKDPSFLHADSEDSDQTGRMPRLIWVFAGRTCHFVGFVTTWLNCLRCVSLNNSDTSQLYSRAVWPFLFRIWRIYNRKTGWRPPPAPYLGKSCSFGLPRVPFVNYCCRFMYLAISFWYWGQNIGSDWSDWSDCISSWSLLIVLLYKTANEKISGVVSFCFVFVFISGLRPVKIILLILSRVNR